MVKGNKVKSFEEGLSRLEEIVLMFEKGENDLEESLVLFEEGIEIAKYCSRKLKDAELRIEKLINWDGDKVPLSLEEGE
jgi:exodeoxyribonuclease VII small subunit